MKFFEGWVSLFKTRSIDKDLQNWAKIEYKQDSEFAYNYMISNGTAPGIGATR